MKKRWISLLVALSVVAGCITVQTLADDKHVVDPVSYFDVTGADVELKDESIHFILTEENATVKFKKALATSGYSLKFNGVDDSANKLESVEMTMTDSENEDCSVKIGFYKLSDDSTAVRYNDDTRSYLTAGSLNKLNATDMSILFQETTNTFTDDAASYSMKVEDCENGTKFDGFDSMGAMVSWNLSGKKGAVFSIKSINSQRIGSNYTEDTVEPYLCLDNSVTKVSKGMTCILPPTRAYDVYSDDVTLKLTVQDPDGDVIKDTSGKALEDVDGTKEYEIKFDKYGQYRIVYVASDGTNKTRGIGYQIAVNDEGAPEIQLKESLPGKVTVGTTVEFPEMIVKDNVSETCETWVNVLHPAGYMTCESDSFVADEEGIYTITFCANDENGNIGRFVVKIFAERGDK